MIQFNVATSQFNMLTSNIWFEIYLAQLWKMHHWIHDHWSKCHQGKAACGLYPEQPSISVPRTLDLLGSFARGGIELKTIVVI